MLQTAWDILECNIEVHWSVRCMRVRENMANRCPVEVSGAHGLELHPEIG